ncbi:MAG: helix-turn-helix domain-containing protein [Solirubrobacteraceae bacterium]
MDEIGARLREARMRARIDINEVELRTKIRAKYLRAMENEEWGLLPGDVYVKSFLRTYCEFLGLDSRQLIDDYKRRYERPSDVELRPIAPLGAERDRDARRRGRRGGGGPPVPPGAAIAVVLVAVVVALVLIGLNNNGKGGSTPPSTSRTSSTTTSAKATKPSRRGGARHHSAGPSTGGGATATTVKLQLAPTGPGPVYVCLVNASGKQLISGVIYNVGQTIPTKTASKLLLTLGNASVSMKVNGARVNVPSTGRPVGYELTPTSQTLLPAARQPQCG